MQLTEMMWRSQSAATRACQFHIVLSQCLVLLSRMLHVLPHFLRAVVGRKAVQQVATRCAPELIRVWRPQPNP